MAKMNLLMNRAMIAESQKAINQAQEVTKLTRLAFIFIPISFTASFFGMNLGPLVQGAIHGIWLWFAVSAPVVIISMLLMKWDISELAAKVVRRREKLSSISD